MHLFQVRRQLPSFANLQNHGFLPSCAHYDVTYGASLSARPKRQTVIESEMREDLDFSPWNKVDPFTGLAYPRSATTLRLVFLTSARLISDYLTRNPRELIQPCRTPYVHVLARP